MNKKATILLVLAAVMLAMLLAGCQEETGGIFGTTAPTEPQGPTVPADGDPHNVTCQGSYTVEGDFPADTAVAMLGSAKLTNAQLQVYYRMAVSSYAGENGPDLSQPLDIQLCDADDTAVTWQQYFLRQALETWRSRQAVALQAVQMDFTPGQPQQAHLDSLAELTGGDAALLDYARLLNESYLYVSQCYDAAAPTQEQIDAWIAENVTEPEPCVDIRYILLAPGSEDAETILQAYQKSDQKEDDFAFLATEYSLDTGSSTNGGLYAGLRKGWLQEELDAWCFDPARQPGEYTVIETARGVHILYFRGSGNTAAADAVAALTEQSTRQLLEDMQEAHTLQVDYSAIALEELKLYDVTDAQLLYTDPEQENYTEVPYMSQQDYRDAYYGPGRTVSSHGCGLTCFAMVATYLLDEEQSPAVLGPRFAAYSAPEGTARVLFEEGPAQMGFGLYKRTMDDEEALTALKEGHVVVSLQQVGLFTKGGHFIVLTRFQEDGKITVLDPNSFNYVGNSIREDGFANGFAVEHITAGARIYWVYEKKHLNDPACARCGDANQTVLFAETYYCDDCRVILSRRALFDEYCG